MAKGVKQHTHTHKNNNYCFFLVECEQEMNIMTEVDKWYRHSTQSINSNCRFPHFADCKMRITWNQCIKLYKNHHFIHSISVHKIDDWACVGFVFSFFFFLVVEWKLRCFANEIEIEMRQQKTVDMLPKSNRIGFLISIYIEQKMNEKKRT